MPTPHPRPWHRNSVFGDGPRVPLCRERRAVWKARIEIMRRAGRITADHGHVGLALLKRLGTAGRCDPSHQTLATDSGEDVSTVQRALKAFNACGMVTWVRRLRRDGSHVSQDTNAYVLTLGEAPRPVIRCDRQSARETNTIDKSMVYLSVPSASSAEIAAAQAVMAQRRRVIQQRLLGKGCDPALRGS
jgi:hypothetical protein